VTWMKVWPTSAKTIGSATRQTVRPRPLVAGLPATSGPFFSVSSGLDELKA
jgi:hypothetical protein